MNKLFRALGAFVYASIIAIAFLALSSFILAKGIVSIDGFWKTTIFVIVMIVFFAWLSEKGLQLLSIPFNWLWDETMTARIVTAVPAVIVGLWCLAAPFRIPMKFTTGDWVLVVIWWLGVLFFYVNFFLMPFISKDMGIKGNR